MQAIISNTIRDCPGATIDLIGHSLGGAVGLRFLMQYSETEEVKHIKHLVTLDSPVNGISWNDFAHIAKFVGDDNALGSEVAQELAAIHDLPRQSLVTVFGEFKKRGIIIRTLASLEDLVVLYQDAIVQDFGDTLSLGVSPIRCGLNEISIDIDPLPPIYAKFPWADASLCTGHGQVLSDPNALNLIAAALLPELSRLPAESDPALDLGKPTEDEPSARLKPPGGASACMVLKPGDLIGRSADEDPGADGKVYVYVGGVLREIPDDQTFC